MPQAAQSHRLGLRWHLSNGLAGGVASVTCAFIVLWIIGIISGQPRLVAQRLLMVTLGTTVTIAAFALACRTTKKLSIVHQLTTPVLLGGRFHLANATVTLLLGFSLFVVLALVLPSLTRSANTAHSVVLLATAVVPIVILTIASSLAERRFRKIMTTEPEK